MTPTWRSYSPYVSVSAGLLITGVLWFTRIGATIRGEDLAETLSAALERHAAYANTNPDHPVDPFTLTNNLSTFPTLAAVARTVTQTRLHVTPRDAFHPYLPILWLDPDAELPADHAEIARALPVWTVTNQITGWDDLNRTLTQYDQHGPFTPSGLGAWTPLLTLDTRLPPTLSTFAPSTATVSTLTNLPAATLLFAHYYPDPADTALPEPGTQSDYWSGFGNWWTYNLSRDGHLSTNLYAITPYETPSTNGVWAFRDTPIRTNILEACKKTLHAMRRTLYLPASFSYTSIVTREAAAEWVTNQIDVAGCLLRARLLADATPWTTNTSGGTLSGPYIPADCQIFAQEQTDTVTGGDRPTNIYSTALTFQSSQTRLHGITFGYPHPQVLASGLVSRVRIYAILSGLRAWPTDILLSSDGYSSVQPFTVLTNHTYTFLSQAVDANLYTAYTLGCRSAVAGTTLSMSTHRNFTYDFSGAQVDETAAESLYFWSDFSAIPSTLKWNLVYDSGSNPSSVPPLDFLPLQSGTDGPWTVTPQQRTGHSDTGPEGQGTAGGTDTRSIYGNWFVQSITCRFIIIVDWSFKHLNPDNPYVPLPHTPGWIP